MPKVFDCTIFWSELDMLELRMNILDPVVDYFVVCEAEETHSGQPKPLNLLANWDRFKPWHKKLIFVNAGPLSDGQRNSWQREYYHRSCIAKGLTSAKSEDWIIVADCDEIPRPEVVAEIKYSDLQAAKLELDMYYYSCNFRVKQGWSVGIYRKWIEPDPNKIRSCAGYNPIQILNAGHHFSYFGGPEQVLSKIDSFMHHNDVAKDVPRDVNWIKRRMDQGLDLYGRDLVIEHVPLSDTLPKCILDHQDYYGGLGWVE